MVGLDGASSVARIPDCSDERGRSLVASDAAATWSAPVVIGWIGALESIGRRRDAISGRMLDVDASDCA